MNFNQPPISAIIPTYNKEHTIGGLLEDLKELGAEDGSRAQCRRRPVRKGFAGGNSRPRFSAPR
jgi:hypothetical protein